MNNRSSNILLYSLISVILVCFISTDAFCITLEEAVQRAIGVSYPIKEQKELVKKSEYSYISTIDPYLPRADIQSGYTRYLNSLGDSATRQSSGAYSIDRDMYTATGSLSLRLFDGGYRYAKRQGAFSILGREQERLDDVRRDVLYNVKSLFFAALGRKAVITERTEMYEATRRIHSLTRARYDEGVAKKSELLQAEVRMTSSKIDLFDATKEYEKALEELRSYLLFGEGDDFGVEGNLDAPSVKANQQYLISRALKARPDVLAQEKEIERLNMVYKEKRSDWFPKIDVELQQARTDKSFFPDGRLDTFGLNFTFPLFDGVGRYYNMEGALKDVQAAKYRLQEIKRNVSIEIVKAYKDYELSRENVGMYRELLREATSNYEQAFGEYKVGKGDIVALLQTEKDLASAKENLVMARYKSNNMLALLEKVSYTPLGAAGEVMKKGGNYEK